MSIDTIAPTPERLRKGSFDTPTVDRQREARAWRDKTVPEKMGLDPELVSGFEDFEADYMLAIKEPVQIGGYGERIPSGDDLHERAFAVAKKRISGRYAVNRALTNIADPITGDVLLALCVGAGPEEIGRTVLGRKSKPVAIAAAHERIAVGCRALAIHYGYIARPRGDP